MIRNSIKEEMYAQTKTVGTRRVHTLYEGPIPICTQNKSPKQINKV